MTTTYTAFVPAVVAPDFDSFAVRQAIAGFLAGYGDTTRDAYGLDLRQWLRWCTSHELRVFEVRRAHIELFARSLEQDGKARATVARRLSTIAGFYRYCALSQLERGPFPVDALIPRQLRQFGPDGSLSTASYRMVMSLLRNSTQSTRRASRGF